MSISDDTSNEAVTQSAPHNCSHVYWIGLRVDSNAPDDASAMLQGSISSPDPSQMEWTDGTPVKYSNWAATGGFLAGTWAPSSTWDWEMVQGSNDVKEAVHLQVANRHNLAAVANCSPKTKMAALRRWMNILDYHRQVLQSKNG